MCFQLVDGIGLGVLFIAPQFPVLAPLPVTETARALALYMFIRCLGQAFGITVGATILQNELKKRLPQELTTTFPQGVEIAYAIIPTLKDLPQPLRGEVQTAFASSLHTMWYVMAGLAVFGFLCVFGFKHLDLHSRTDENWGMEEKGKVDQAAA